MLQREFTIPTWLRLFSPTPAIYDTTKTIHVEWEFLDYPSPVNVFAYNFKTGDYLLSVHGVGTKNYILPADKLQPSTLLRIYVIEQWSRKQTLSGDGIIEGSEIEIIPWSQVFIRIKK